MLLWFCGGVCDVCGERGDEDMALTTSPKQHLPFRARAALPSSFIGTLSSILSHWPGIQVQRTTEFQQVDPIVGGDQKNILEELCHQRKAFNPLLHLLLA